MVSVERDQNYFRKNSSDKQYSKLYFDEIDEHKTVLSFSQYLFGLNPYLLKFTTLLVTHDLIESYILPSSASTQLNSN